MYDWYNTMNDYIDGIAHFQCILDIEVHCTLYEWILEALELPYPRPRQIEFARLNLTYTVMSKRKLIQLVEDGFVNGWDDPRMITIAGLRRRVALRPIKVVLTNYPKDQVEELDAINNPEDPNSGARKLLFSDELFIDSADFMETP